MREDYSLKVYGVILKYPPFVSKKVDRVEHVFTSGNGRVVIHNPLVHARPWKLFLYGLWAGEKVDMSKDAVQIVLSENSGLYLSFMSFKEISKAIDELMSLRYMIYSGAELKTQIVYQSRYEEKERRLYLKLPAEFYRLCEEEGLRLYVPFLLHLQGKNEIALFTILSSRSENQMLVNRLKIETLVRLAGLNTDTPLWKKVQSLTLAFQSLKEIGFIKDFVKDGDVFEIHRYDKNTLRLKALELKRLYDQRFEEIKAKARENMKKSRQKKKENRHHQEPELPF